MADQSIPSWAVPAKGSTPETDTTPPQAQNAPPSNGGGNIVSNAVSKVKSFVSGLFGGNKQTTPAPTPAPTQSNSQIPSWAVPAKTTTKSPATSTPSTPKTTTPPTQSNSNIPSWAVPAKSGNGPLGASPLGDLVKPDTSVEDGTPAQFNTDELTSTGAVTGLSPSDWATGTLDTAKSLAQAIPRTAASVGVLIGQTGQVISNYFNGVDTNSVSGLTVPKNMQWLLGSDEIDSPAQEMDKITQSIQNSPLAKTLGLDKFAKQIGFAGVLGNDALVFYGGDESGLGLSDRDATIAALAKAGTEEEVLPILQKIGMHDDIASDLAPHIAQMTDKSEISDALDLAQNVQNARAFLPEAEGMNDSASGDPYKTSYSTSAIDQAQTSIKTAYADIAPEALDEATGQILTEMELSEAGSRLITGTGADRTVTGISSTFPKFIPENLRSKDLFNKVLEYIDPTSEKFGTFPPGNRPKQRALIYELYNELDNRLGVDTAQSRNDIINEYQAYDEDKANEITKTSGGSSTGGEIDEQEVADKFGGNGSSVATQDSGVDGEESQQNDITNKSGGVIPSDGTGEPATIIHPGDTPPPPPPIPSVNEVKAQLPEAIQAESDRIQSIKDLMRGRYEDAKAQKESEKQGNKNKDRHLNVSSGDQLNALQDSESNTDIKKGPFKGITQKTVNAMQDFMNARKKDTVYTVGAIVKNRFKGLEPEGLSAIIQFEGYQINPKTGRPLIGEDGGPVKIPTGPVRTGLYGQMEKGLEDFFDVEKDEGIPLKHRKNYLPIYLKDVPEEGSEPVGGRQVGLHPSFSMQREYESNTHALIAGRQLIYPNAADIMGQRAMDSQHALSNQRLINYLGETGNLIPEKEVTKPLQSSFLTYDNDRFPKPKSSRYTDSEGVIHEYHGPYKGPANVVKVINQYLKEPNEFWQKWGSRVGAVKNFALSVGIPKTGLSIHYFNLLPREVIENIARQPLSLGIKETSKFLAYGASPNLAGKYVQDNLEKILPFLEKGLTLSSEGHTPEVYKTEKKPIDTSTTFGKVHTTGRIISNTLYDLYAKNLFEKIIPARKIFRTLETYQMLVDKGVSVDDAQRMASVMTNDMYGGINTDQLGRDKDFQNKLSTWFIAPDFGESTINAAKNTGKGLGDLFKTSKNTDSDTIKNNSVQAKIYRNIFYAFLGVYATANIIQKEKNGTYMYQNDPLHQLSIAWGKDSKDRTRYINFAGTGEDQYRLPLQIGSALVQNRYKDLFSILRNRLSIPASSVVSILSNTDWAGQNIFGPDVYGNPQSTSKQWENFFNNTVGNAAPAPVTSIENLISGNTSPEQALTQGVGLPVGYVNQKPNDTTIKQLEDDAKTGIASGDYTLYDQLVKAKVISQRSRAAFIRSALTGTRSAKQIKESAKAKAKLTEEEKELESEGFSK